MIDLERLTRDGFDPVRCTEKNVTVRGDVRLVWLAIYLFGEAGPYYFLYPADAETPFFVTRDIGSSSLMLIAPHTGPWLLSLRAHPQLHDALESSGYEHYVDAHARVQTA